MGREKTNEELVQSSNTSDLVSLRKALQNHPDDFEGLIKGRFVDFKTLIFKSLAKRLRDDPSPMDYWQTYRELATISDCDGASGSPLPATEMLYRVLWDEKWPNGAITSGDTMNSLFSRMRERDSLKHKCSSDSELKQVDEQLNLLAYLTHTLGNFIPVPGFVQRAHAWCSEYWDTLLKVFQMECEKKGSSGKEWKDLGYAVETWIGEYDSEAFGKFIKNYMLEVYCEEGGTSESSYVVRSFNGHDSGDFSATTLANCLADMNACIIIRGNQMLKELQEKWDKEEVSARIKGCLPDNRSPSKEAFFRQYTNDESAWEGCSA